MRQAPSAFRGVLSQTCGSTDSAVGLSPTPRRPLEASPLLAWLGQQHSEDMAVHSFFSTSALNGSSPAQLLQTSQPRLSSVAQIIAAGWTSVRDVVLQFLW